jgi:p24 family protein delta-1
MRKLEGVVKEIVDEMNYLKTREERFQSTNSTLSVLFEMIISYVLSPVSTNSRVQNFAYLMLASLIGLGVWQVFHLRAFFKRKYLID